MSETVKYYVRYHGYLYKFYSSVQAFKFAREIKSDEIYRDYPGESIKKWDFQKGEWYRCV